MEQRIRTKLADKGLAESSINVYIRQLEKLNNNEPIKSLSYLANTEKILQKINQYKINTAKLYLSAIVAVLDVATQKRPKHYDVYKERLDELKVEYNSRDKNVKNAKETDNWVEYDDVKNLLDDLLSNVNKIKNKKTLSIGEYDVLLKAFILSLYVLLPPRRNQDYLKMLIVKSDSNNDKNNYLVLKQNKFIFNEFKTKKTGSQEISFDDNAEFKYILKIYLKFHPLLRQLKSQPFTNNTDIPLLVNYEGKPLTHINSITRILNKIFGKKIGSTMLRKIYISSKFGDNMDKLKEMKDVAEKMGHSSATQQSVYLKE
jgi:hypothetical protein